MIFRQWQEVLEGRKTQTRRIVKPAEWCCAYPFWWNPGERAFSFADVMPPVTEVYTARPKAMEGDGRLKWAVGRTYAVTPKRGKGAIWWQQMAEHREWQELGKNGWDHTDELGYQQARIEIVTIRLEWLQDISEVNAIAEGYPHEWPPNPMQSYIPEDHPAPIDWYHHLWDSLAPRAVKWEDNPQVWVLDFELVR
jgi:hypothetical protein